MAWIILLVPAVNEWAYSTVAQRLVAQTFACRATITQKKSMNMTVPKFNKVISYTEGSVRGCRHAPGPKGSVSSSATLAGIIHIYIYIYVHIARDRHGAGKPWAPHQTPGHARHLDTSTPGRHDTWTPGPRSLSAEHLLGGPVFPALRHLAGEACVWSSLAHKMLREQRSLGAARRRHRR